MRRPSLPDLNPAERLLLQPAFRALGDAATSLVPSSLRELAGLPAAGPRELPSRVAVTTASNAVAIGLRIPLLRHAVQEPLTRTLGTKRRPRVPAAA